MEIEYIQTVSTTDPEPIVVVESVNQTTKHRRSAKRCRMCVSVLVKAAPFVFCFLCGAFTIDFVRYHALVFSNSHGGNSVGCTSMFSNTSNVIAEHTSTPNESNTTINTNSSHPTAERPIEDTRTHSQIHQTTPSPPAGGRQGGGGMWGPATRENPVPLMGELELHFRELSISCPWLCYPGAYHDYEDGYYYAMDTFVVVNYTISEFESNSVIALKPLLVTVYRDDTICHCKSTDFYYDPEESTPTPQQPPQQPHLPPFIPPYPVDNNDEYVATIPPPPPPPPPLPSPPPPLSPAPPPWWQADRLPAPWWQADRLPAPPSLALALTDAQPL